MLRRIQDRITDFQHFYFTNDPIGRIESFVDSKDKELAFCVSRKLNFIHLNQSRLNEISGKISVPRSKTFP